VVGWSDAPDVARGVLNGPVEIAQRPGLAGPAVDFWVSPRRRAIGRALAYMKLHSHRRLLLAEVASVAHMSQFHFSRSFHRIVGVTFQDHLVRLRLRDAERLLRQDPSAPLRLVAAQAGFGTLRNLQDHYRRAFGCPPSRGRVQALWRSPERDAKDNPIALARGTLRRPHREQGIGALLHGPSP